MSVLLYTLPFMWLSFGQTALLSLLSNLVLIPLAQVAMIAALLMLLFTPLPYLVYACAVVVSGTTGGMLWLVEKFSALGAPIIDLTGPLTCVAIGRCVCCFSACTFCCNGSGWVLRRQWPALFYLLTSFAGLAVEQGNAYLCIGSSSALLYDTHYALLVGTPDQSAYYAYTRILQNRRLQLVAVYLPDDRVGYYTRALTAAVHPVNVLLPGGNTALAVQPECEHLLTATAMNTTPWQGVQVQYRYNKKRYTVSITCKGKRLVLGNGTDLNGGDLTVAFGKQSTAVGMLVRAGATGGGRTADSYAAAGQRFADKEERSMAVIGEKGAARPVEKRHAVPRLFYLWRRGVLKGPLYWPKLRKKAVDPAFADFNIHIYEKDGTQLSDVLHDADTFPMMGGSNLVLVYDFPFDKKADVEDIKAYLKDVPDTTVLVFTYQSLPVDTKRKNAGTALLKLLLRPGTRWS